MAQYKVILFALGKPSDIGNYVADFFDAELVNSFDKFTQKLQATAYKVIVFDVADHDIDIMLNINRLVRMEEVIGIPVVVLSPLASLDERIQALEVGCDDFIEADVDPGEVCARVTRSIYHRVATDQLALRLESANQATRSALTDIHDLQSTIRFLLNVHECNNVDQLGQLFFSAVERYGFACSIQMRAEGEVKNMEAHGMAKDLESQLLSQLKTKGKFVDFGKRTIINFEAVSVLIKNMPEDVKRREETKTNFLNLMRGIDERIQVFDMQSKLRLDRQALTKLSGEVRSVMNEIQESYQRVMRKIAREVDHTNEVVQLKIPGLAITEEDERYLEEVMDSCVKNTVRIFNEGLMIDEEIARLEEIITHSIEAVDSPSFKKAGNKKGRPRIFL